MNAAITGVLSIIGVAVGAVLHNFLTKQNNAANQLLEARNQAYVDFLEAVSLLVSAQRLGKKEQELEQLARLTHAKARICIFGGESVVKQLSAFWREGASLETEPEIQAFTRLVLDIRRSLGLADREFLGSDVSQLLFDIKPPPRK